MSCAAEPTTSMRTMTYRFRPVAAESAGWLAERGTKTRCGRYCGLAMDGGRRGNGRCDDRARSALMVLSPSYLGLASQEGCTDLVVVRIHYRILQRGMQGVGSTTELHSVPHESLHCAWWPGPTRRCSAVSSAPSSGASASGHSGPSLTSRAVAVGPSQSSAASRP